MLGNPSDPAPKTVLVVEDNELNLKLLNDLLEYQGYRVIATPLGEPALGLAQQYKPDLILMDIQLPDISGMEATQRLKSDEQTRTIPSSLRLRRLPCLVMRQGYLRAGVTLTFLSRFQRRGISSAGRAVDY